MKTYNKIMEWFWLSIGILILIVVTVMGFMEGFERWVYYYVLDVFAFGTYFMRRWMRKRMEKHLEWLEQQKQQQAQNPE